MNLKYISFYQASRGDKVLVTVSGPQLRAAGFPVPSEKNATLTLTLCYYMDDEEVRKPVEFRVNRAPGKTLGTKFWPEECPRPKCGNSREGIAGEPVEVGVIPYGSPEEPAAAPQTEEAQTADS